MAILSQAKIYDLKQELDSLQASLQFEKEEAAKRGGAMDSFKEAAAVEASLAAKQQRANELASVLKNVEVLSDDHKHIKEVALGCSVSIEILETGSQISYQIVDSFESDPSNYKISINSPLGAILLGKKIGDKFSFMGKSYLIISLK